MFDIEERSEPTPRIQPEFVPIAGMNPLFMHVSGARQAMYTGNLPQALVVPGATRQRIRSGLEREHARSTIKHMFDRDVVILDVIPRFDNAIHKDSFDLNPLDVVIFEDYETRQMGIMELSRFHVSHQMYGFRFKFNEEILNKLQPKARIPAGTIVADSPNVTPDGDYMYCLETNVAMMSDPLVIEDGVGYSESYARRIQATAFETRTITIKKSHYLGNVYGNDEIFQAIPNIGEYVNNQGILCAMRPYDKGLNGIYMTRKKLFKPVYGLDTLYYAPPGARVVDIHVMRNEVMDTSSLPKEMTAQFDRYYEADKRFYMRVIKTCLARNSKYLREDVNLSPELIEFLYHAIGRVGTDLVKEGLLPKSDEEILRTPRNYRDMPLDEYQITVTLEYKTSVGEGPKITDTAGSKGVSVKVIPDEDMPVDKFGNRAEVIMAGESVVNRMNVGRDHIQLIGAAGRDVIKRIRRSYGLPDMGPVDEKEVMSMLTHPANKKLTEENFDYLMGFYKLLTPTTQYAKLSRPGIRESGRHIKHLLEVIKDGEEPYGLYLDIPANTPIKMDEVIREIATGIYRPEISTVTYRNHAGELVETVEPILIGPMPFMALEKTATDWSAVSSSKTSQFGTTARLTAADKYSSPGRQVVTRSMDESTVRNLAHAMGAEYVADIADMNNNPVVHKEVCKTILTSETPSNIEELVDRKQYPQGGHRPLSYAHHHFLTTGVGLKND